MDGTSGYKTTSIYAEYAPNPSQGAEYAAKAFRSEPANMIMAGPHADVAAHPRAAEAQGTSSR